jgi:hypothetical protein
MTYQWLLLALLAATQTPLPATQVEDFACLYQMDIKRPTSAKVYGMDCSKYGIYSASPLQLYSSNIACLLSIYKMYDRTMEGDCYILRDTSDTEDISDLKFSLDKPTHGPVDAFVYDNHYTKKLREIRKSYLKWAHLVEKEGIDAVRAKGISPLSGTPYIWRRVGSN